MTEGQLKKKLLDLSMEIEGAMQDSTLESKERYDLLADLRSIKEDIHDVLRHREEWRKATTEGENEIYF